MTEGEALFLLKLLKEKYGPGYSEVVQNVELRPDLGLKEGEPREVERVHIGRIQGKLSIAAQAGKQRRISNPSSRELSATGDVRKAGT